MEFRGGVTGWFMVCHVRHRVFDVIHGRFDVVSWAVHEVRCGVLSCFIVFHVIHRVSDVIHGRFMSVHFGVIRSHDLHSGI